MGTRAWLSCCCGALDLSPEDLRHSTVFERGETGSVLSYSVSWNSCEGGHGGPSIVGSPVWGEGDWGRTGLAHEECLGKMKGVQLEGGCGDISCLLRSLRAAPVAAAGRECKRVAVGGCQGVSG